MNEPLENVLGPQTANVTLELQRYILKVVYGKIRVVKLVRSTSVIHVMAAYVGLQH